MSDAVADVMTDGRVDIKFCGLTRATDAALAMELGAAYAGVIFADSPRHVTVEQAKTVLAAVDGVATRRVGVFGPMPTAHILDIARAADLNVLQLAGSAVEQLAALRSQFRGALWAVLQVSDTLASLPEVASNYYRTGADAVVLDAAVVGKLGGTGITLDWKALAPAIRTWRQQGQVVLAGGLRPENVAQAIAQAGPDVVDVSSGVEVTPGIKDPQRMRAFAAAGRR